MFGAVSVATACVTPGSVAAEVAGIADVEAVRELEVEHPTGFFTVAMDVALEGGEVKVRRSALLDLGLFSFSTFSWGNITAAMVAVGEFAIIFVLPLYLINALGLDVMGAGLVLAAMAAGAFLSGAAARHLAARAPC